MTGFGRGVASSPTKKITVELKSVNSKQLDLSMRVPSYFRELEITMRADLARRLQRGKVEMVVNVENLVPEAPSAINVDVMRQYKQQIIQAVETLDNPVPSDWCSVLLRLPEALKTDVRQVDDADEQAFLQGLRRGCGCSHAFQTR